MAQLKNTQISDTLKIKNLFNIDNTTENRNIGLYVQGGYGNIYFGDQTDGNTSNKLRIDPVKSSLEPANSGAGYIGYSNNHFGSAYINSIYAGPTGIPITPSGGNWTPTVAGATLNSSVSKGIYRDMGCLRYLAFYVQLASRTSSNNFFEIKGFPLGRLSYTWPFGSGGSIFRIANFSIPSGEPSDHVSFEFSGGKCLRVSLTTTSLKMSQINNDFLISGSIILPLTI